MTILLSMFGALGLALVHLLADRIHRLHGIPRSSWLSFAGGTSVAFVFLHLMPELHEAQLEIAEQIGGTLALLDHHLYLASMVGLIVYYGVEHAALRRTGRGGDSDASQSAVEGFFWVHVALFALFNALIAYLLIREAAEGLLAFAVLWAALALHTFSNDFALREHHRDDYHRLGRWILASSPLAGWVAGALIAIPVASLNLALGFVAGGIVLNALKEELPPERQSRFGAFVLGAGAYTVLTFAA
jgi:hypothetical protein